MPMPTTIEMNITENSERWPMTSVATPMAQACEGASTTSMMRGRPGRGEEREEQEREREREREDGGALAVAEGGGHLVVRQRRLASHPHLDVRELVPERGDHAARALDRGPLGCEARALDLGLRQDEQQLLVA